MALRIQGINTPSKRYFSFTLFVLLFISLSFVSIIKTSANNPTNSSADNASGKIPTYKSAVGPLLMEQPVSEFKARRQRLMEKLPDGVTILLGKRDDGQLGVEEKFRQYENFVYLTGIEVPDSILVLVPKGYKGAKEWLFIPSRNPADEQWTGPQPAPDEATAQAFGVERIAPAEEFNKILFDILDSNSPQSPKMPVNTIVPGGRHSVLFSEGDLVQKIREKSPDTPIVPMVFIFSELRMVKSEPEVALLQRAINITGNAQESVRKHIKPGMFEYELEGLIMGEFYRGGAQRPAFPCIVGSGINSTILHYETNRKKIDDNDLVVVDIGAEYNYYAADITRTYPANGKFSPRQREIYNLVLQAQTDAFKSFKPGVTTMGDLQTTATITMRNSKLRDSKGRTLDTYFIHGLGHFLGMQVHDVGDYGRPLPVGAVITIEPGIYIGEEKIGVRIEDDYLVTEKGLVKLSQDIPSDADEIEKLLQSRK